MDIKIWKSLTKDITIEFSERFNCYILINRQTRFHRATMKDALVTKHKIIREKLRERMKIQFNEFF